MKKVLVAGATGYLGKHVVREFKSRGYWVRALARNPQKLEQTGPFLEPAVRDCVDDVFVAEATQPETLVGLCDGIDVVFSSLGTTRQKQKLPIHAVDYQANRNILDQAIAAGVETFIFVSALHGERLKHLTLAAAREQLVDELRTCGLNYAVMRPTGFFSDLTEYLRMANRGRAYLIGSGTQRVNPIHGADLAVACVDALDGTQTDIPVGGPESFTQQEIAELAFSVLGKPPKITRIPLWLAKLAVLALWPFSSRLHAIAEFFVTVSQLNMEAPKTGTHTLRDYYQQFASTL